MIFPTHMMISEQSSMSHSKFDMPGLMKSCGSRVRIPPHMFKITFTHVKTT